MRIPDDSPSWLDARASGPGSFGPSSYGDSFADVYDTWYGDITDAAATAAFVASRCDPGLFAELGVGTGRLVDDLVGHNLTVIGIDASAPMLDRCRPRSGLHRIRADISRLPFGPRPVLQGALCAFNTLFNLPSRTAQTMLFRTIGGALTGDGPLVVEASTAAGLADSDPQSIGVSRLEDDRLVLSATTIDGPGQVIRGQHVDITNDGIRLRPWTIRWSTPTQLDEMAESVGLRLVERHADWNESPFGDGSPSHVSVYRRAVA